MKLSKTPAPKSERIYGSKTNAPKSSSTPVSANKISFSDETLNSIKNKISEHNKKYPKKKISLSVAKAVVRRGMGAYSSTHRPTISGGKPNSRVAWGLARLNAFIYKIQKGHSKSGKYSQDNDLIRELGYRVSKFNDGGELKFDEEAQQLIDIISMNPNLEQYQKYKLILKDKFGIDFDLIYKDQEYIENANLNDIKKKDDFLDFDNWLKYAKIISKKRGFIPMNLYDSPNNKYELTDEIWNETAKKLNFNVKKIPYIERGTGSGDIARAFGDTIYYTDQSDIYYFLHELGHVYDFQNRLEGIIKNPAYSPTNYGTTHSGETFAENFAIYFINPIALKNWNEDVYNAMDLVINDKYKKEIYKILSKNHYSNGGEALIAPNGKPSNLTPEQYRLVRTSAFKKWFGDWEKAYQTGNYDNVSKVIDENTKEPLVVYHGTFKGVFYKFSYRFRGKGADINSFGDFGKGFYFSPTKNIAKNYAKKLSKRENGTPYIFEVFLNIKNPFNMYLISKIEKERFILVRKYGVFNIPKKELKNLYDKYKIKESDYYELSSLESDIGDNWYDLDISIKGYDGVINSDKSEYIALKSNQIKLADGTNTTFNSNNPDIRYADGGNINSDLEYIKKSIINDFQSGSSLDFYLDLIFVIGDDAKDIVILNKDFVEVNRVNVFESKTQRIEKDLKSDLETSTIVDIDGIPNLLILGSGAKKEFRSVGYLIPLNTKTVINQPFRYNNFVSRLKNEDSIKEINIEGCCSIGDKILLSNRGNKRNPDNILIITENKFWENQDNVPIQICRILIPDKDAAVSELHYDSDTDTLFFTASIEHTTNAIDDGKIGDSFLGYIKNVRGKLNKNTIEVDWFYNLTELDIDFVGQKIEGLCIEEKNEDYYTIDLVSDNDNEESTIFKIKIKNTFG